MNHQPNYSNVGARFSLQQHLFSVLGYIPVIITEIWQCCGIAIDHKLQLDPAAWGTDGRAADTFNLLIRLSLV